MVFYKRHLCRLEQRPTGVGYAVGPGFGQQPYMTMWGPSEFGTVLGNLRDCDVTDRLHEIAEPTLITGGRHEEARPAHLEATHQRIQGSGAGHLRTQLTHGLR